VIIKAVKKYYFLDQLVSNYTRIQKKLNNNQSAIQALKANERRHAVAKGIPYPTPAILDEI